MYVYLGKVMQDKKDSEKPKSSNRHYQINRVPYHFDFASFSCPVFSCSPSILFPTSCSLTRLTLTLQHRSRKGNLKTPCF